MKSLKIIFSLVIVAILVSCGDKRTPQSQYMPDMYESIPYNSDGAKAPYNDGISNLKPVDGTIKRGGVAAYDIPDTIDGYEKAKAELKNPLEASEANLENGKKMYGIYCAICHGKKGDGQGYLATSEKFAGIPS